MGWPSSSAAASSRHRRRRRARGAEPERRNLVANQGESTVAGDDEYAFKHILMRDVAYGQVPKGRRAELHVRFAEWMTALPSSADELVEIVAWHLEQACRCSREVGGCPA